MKNKKLTYLLLPLVLIIWGYLIYKVVIGLAGNDTDIVPSQTHSLGTIQATFRTESNETFMLKDVERDPFLNISYRKKLENKTGKITRKKVSWPEIKYMGLVSNEKDKKMIGLIEIEGNNFFFEKGDSYQDITLIKIDPSRVVLTYQGGRKVYSKS